MRLINIALVVAQLTQLAYTQESSSAANTLGKAFSNATTAIEATSPTTTTVTQSKTYDLRTFPTDVPVMALTKGGPELALPVTNLAQNGTLSNQPSAQTVRITTTVFADQTNSEVQAYNGNTFSNTAPGTEIPAGCAAFGPSATIPATGLVNTGDAVGMTTLTSTATVPSATSTVTLTDTAVVVPVQANNTQPINVSDPSKTPYEDNTATEKMTSPVTFQSDNTVGVQTTMSIESIQPAITGVTAYDSIHIPHGHPQLVTGGQDHKNWNTSTSCTDTSIQQVPGTASIPSTFITTTASGVFIGYPPSLSGYNNDANADTSTSIHDSSTRTELATPSVATHMEIPPPPTVPLDSCKPEIWGRPGCLSTPTSFFDVASTVVGHQVPNPTVLAATLAEIPPPPTVPLDSCRPGIWGRPGCLSTPASFSDAYASPVGHQVGDATAVPVSSVVPATIETPATNSTTQPGQAQCTSTFYSLPMDACTSTVYVSKETVTINCLGCVGHHALPPAAPYGSNSCRTSTTITEPCTTRTMCGFSDPTTASGSFVTSVTSLSSASQSGNYTDTA